MSYTTDVKQEISGVERNECCIKAELSAFLKHSAKLSITKDGMNMVISTENPTAAKRILSLLKQCYNIDTQLSVMKKMNLKKNNIYILRILNQARQIIENLEIYSPTKGILSHPSAKMVKKECCTKAYLAGTFLASGSINDPKNTNYHLEVSSSDEQHASFIMKLMNRYDLNAKMIKRRNLYVVYIKQADKISDFLKAIGAYNHMDDFESFRIERDFINSLKRLENCEVANEMKTQEAARKQIDDILLIRKRLGFNTLDEKVKQVALLRLDYPEASLNELCIAYKVEYDEEISKSGMRHRINKLTDLAEHIRENIQKELNEE